MKYILTVLLAFVSFWASAQNHVERNFLTVSALCVSNTLSYTNIACQQVTITTNVAGLLWTNSSGARVAVTAAGANATTALTKDVSLWVDRNSSMFWNFQAQTNAYVTPEQATAMRLQVDMVTGVGGTSNAVTFVIVPVCDGIKDSTHASDAWTFTITPTATGATSTITNVPIYKWLGCESLRLKRATIADRDANQVSVTGIKLLGWVP